MALYRKVLTNLWGEVWFENVGVASKLLYLYALTCDRTTPAGMYQITRQRLAFETHLTEQQLSGALEELEGLGKIYFDEQVGVLWAPDFRLYNDSTSPAWLTGVHKAVLQTPDCSVKDRYLEVYPLAQVALPERLPTVTRPSPQQEQEQEQEQEKEHQHQQAESSIKRLEAPRLTDSETASLGPSESSDSDRTLIRQALELRGRAEGQVVAGAEHLQMLRWAKQYGAQALVTACQATFDACPDNYGGYLRRVLENEHDHQARVRDPP